MSRPSAYVTTIRTVFGLIFVAGSVVHLGNALGDPSVYGAFGRTAWPPLAGWWEPLVMANIGWLVVVMVGFELVVGVSAWLPRRWNRLSVLAMTVFFVFLVFLGYGFPVDAWYRDLLVNRFGSVVMIAVVLPWLLRPQPLSVPAAWRALVRSGGRRADDAGSREG